MYHLIPNAQQSQQQAGTISCKQHSSIQATSIKTWRTDTWKPTIHQSASQKMLVRLWLAPSESNLFFLLTATLKSCSLHQHPIHGGLSMLKSRFHVMMSIRANLWFINDIIVSSTVEIPVKMMRKKTSAFNPPRNAYVWWLDSIFCYSHRPLDLMIYPHDIPWLAFLLIPQVRVAPLATWLIPIEIYGGFPKSWGYP